jgi:hypothetical protein
MERLVRRPRLKGMIRYPTRRRRYRPRRHRFVRYDLSPEEIDETILIGNDSDVRSELPADSTASSGCGS